MLLGAVERRGAFVVGILEVILKCRKCARLDSKCSEADVELGAKSNYRN